MLGFWGPVSCTSLLEVLIRQQAGILVPVGFNDEARGALESSGRPEEGVRIMRGVGQRAEFRAVAEPGESARAFPHATPKVEKAGCWGGPVE